MCCSGIYRLKSNTIQVPNRLFFSIIPPKVNFFFISLQQLYPHSDITHFNITSNILLLHFQNIIPLLTHIYLFFFTLFYDIHQQNLPIFPTAPHDLILLYTNNLPTYNQWYCSIYLQHTTLNSPLFVSILTYTRIQSSQFKLRRCCCW